jgi:hypothetical protein
MRRFGRSGPGDPELEARLRAERPRPSADLVKRVVGERPRARGRGRLTLQLALAAALTALLAGAGMTAGGGNPIGALEQAAQVAEGEGGSSQGNGQGSSGKGSDRNGNGNQGGGQGNPGHGNGHGKPAGDQYGDKITICHRGNSPNNKGETLTLPRQAAEAHLRQHRYDTRGPCPAPPPSKQTICHRGNKHDKGQTATLSPQGAEQHLRNHRYDSRGPCPK